MDLMAELEAFRRSPEQIRSRQARREIREKVLYSRIGEATGRPSAQPIIRDPALEELYQLARTAGGWNLSVDDRMEEGAAIGSQHPGAAALMVVRQALSEYSFPTDLDLRYHGIRRASGHGAFQMDEGIVYVQATLHSVSGPRHYIDIPVIVRQGRMLSPSILLHQGTPRVITQNTFDDILGMGEFSQQVPDRPSMYSPAPDKDAASRPRRHMPRLSPNVYKVLPSKSLIASAVRGFYQPDVSGLVENGSTGASVPGADGSHLDVAERDRSSHFAPGQRVRIKTKATARDRGGISYEVPRGTRGTILRDVDGAGYAYYVRFEELGFSAPVPGSALSGA